MKRRRRIIIAAVVALAAAIPTVAVASGDNDKPITGPALEKATEAAAIESSRRDRIIRSSSGALTNSRSGFCDYLESRSPVSHPACLVSTSPRGSTEPAA